MVVIPSQITRGRMLRILIPSNPLCMVILTRIVKISLVLSMLLSRVIERMVYDPLDLTKLRTITFGYNTFSNDIYDTNQTLIMKSD